MQISKELTDKALLEEIGKRLARQRLALSKTQVELANGSGLARRTIQYAEAGKSIQTESLIRILRSLDLLHALDALLPDQSIRPMDLLRLKSRERRRASKKRRPEAAQHEEQWQWGDED